MGKPQEAVQMYEEALKCDPLNKTINSILYSNRALGKNIKNNQKNIICEIAFMKLNKNEEALSDCNKSLELNEKYVKVINKYQLKIVEKNKIVLFEKS